MAVKMVFFAGIWLAASVVIGMALGKMMEVGGATQERVRLMRKRMRTGSQVQRAPRRAA
jgi:hypothetical protein